MDDSNPEITEHAESMLLKYGFTIIPELEHLEEECLDSPTEMENISTILKKLRFQKIKNSLIDWLDSSDKELIKAAYIINSYQFPKITFEDFENRINKIKQICWLELNPKQTSFEKIEIINNVLFENLNFINSNKIFPSPFDIFIHSVLDTKSGTDFSLGLLYSILAQSLNLPVYGIIPRNDRIPFMLAYLDKNNILSLLNWEIYHNGVLFYISPGLRGHIITPLQLKELYEEENVAKDVTQFEPSPHSLIIKNYLLNIRNSFANYTQYHYKVEDFNELIALFD